MTKIAKEGGGGGGGQVQCSITFFVEAFYESISFAI